MADKVMPTDEEGWQWAPRWGFGANLRGRTYRGATMWHVAGAQGRTDMCRWLKAQGVLDEINVSSDQGATPLIVAMKPWANGAITGHEGTARWMI